MALLEVKNLTKRFGGLVAVNNVDFVLEEGELVGLIGPNGSGKSTFFNLITGIHSITSGKVFYQGKDITGLSGYKIATKGLARTFQATTVFKDMTVFENVAVSLALKRKASSLGQFFNTLASKGDEKRIKETVLEILDYLELINLKDENAKNLPHGSLKLLGIAIAMAVSPKLMLLDEPLTGMNSAESMHVMKKIRGLGKRGITMIVVEHDMGAIMSLSDRIMVFNFGKKIADGKPEEIRKNKDVIDAYLGTERWD